MSNPPVDEIYKNVPGDGSPDWEHTFYGHLSEYGELDIEKFWIFHKALIEVGMLVKEGTSVDRNLAYALLYILDKTCEISNSMNFYLIAVFQLYLN